MKNRIAVIAPEVLPVPPINGGAVETWIHEVVNRVSNSMDIHCFTIFDDKLLKFEIAKDVKYYRFKPGFITKILTLSYKFPFKKSSSYLYWVPYSFWCAWKIRKIKPDIIHIHNRVQFVPIIKLLNQDAKIILHIHQLSAINYKKVWNNKVLQKIDIIIGCSQFLEGEIRKRFGFYKNITYLYNGYDRDVLLPYWIKGEERRVAREKYRILDNEKVILYVGRLAENKGVHLLIKAFSSLTKKYNNIKLLIVGGETQGDITAAAYNVYLKELAEGRGQGKVVFTGKIAHDAMPRYYLLGDILVIPSLVKEGLPLVALEAMACGLPIISSGRGGLSEITNDGETGFIVSDIENITELSKNIEQLINNEDLRLNISRKSYEFVRERFTWQNISKDLDGIYSALLKKQNILIYEYSSGYGGSANALVNIIKHLNNSKFNPIVAIRNFGSQVNRLKNIEIIKLRSAIFDVIKLYSAIKRKKIALVHINNNIIAGIPAIIAAKLARIPCVCHIRQTRRLIRRERIFAKFVDRFLLINKGAVDVYKQDIPEDKLSVIYDGIDLTEFTPSVDTSLRRELNLNGSPIVGLVGRIVKGKGHKEFILASKEVVKVKPDAKFVIVGSAKGDEESYYQEVVKLAKDEKLDENVIFTGWRTDIVNVISGLDVLVQAATTYPEGFGLTIVEAMALRKPVVATNIPGPADIVVDGETGFLVPPQKPNMLAEAILKLLNRRDLAVAMGINGRRRVEELFDVKKSVKKVEELYEQILGI